MTPRLPAPHVVVIGGGIAGTATALALHKAGLTATVYEAAPSGGEDAGAFLTVRSNGMLALAQLDATGAVTAAGFPLTTLELSDEHGQVLATSPIDEAATTPALGPRHLRRAELYRVLQDEAERRGITVEHGRRLVGTRVHDGGVTASFADGTTATGDLLVGADGLRSTVRTCIDPSAPPPRYTGQRVFYGYTTEAAPPTRPEVLHMVRGAQAAFGYTVSPTGETWWFARVPGTELSRAELAGTPAGAWRDWLVARLRQDRTPAAGIVAATGDELLADNVHDLPGVATWQRGPMLIVGDAAHAASPASGSGASMALEDAVMLGKSLRDLPDHTEAFSAYERLRRARVDFIIANGARLSPPRMPDRHQRAAHNDRTRSQHAGRGAELRNWLMDYPLDWDLPVSREHAEEVAASHRPAP